MKKASPMATASSELADLLTNSRGKRISPASLRDRPIWIKWIDAEKRPIGKRLHALLNPILPAPFLKASPELALEDYLERETRKMERFRAAGLQVPDLIHAGPNCLILSDQGSNVEKEFKRLSKTDPEAADRLLVRAAEAMGQAHARGLCHGRPHLRDMFIAGETIGFLDFEEEPEAVMPLATAQARDIWMLFMHIADKACDPASEIAAFEAYRSVAPLEVLEELREIVRFVGVLIPLLRLMRLLGLGEDGVRILASTAFLKRTMERDGVSAGTTESDEKS
jgi:tRNA A-37 threonylcarbamoyl transferase component Bud32